MFLERFRANVAAAFAAVARAPEGAVVVHCMGGKDRTGLLVALLLHVAGVDDEQIAADYALSEERLRPRHEAWLAEAGTEAERERIRRIAATPAESMLGVLEELERRYGSVEAYLRAGGVGDEELRARAQASAWLTRSSRSTARPRAARRRSPKPCASASRPRSSRPTRPRSFAGSRCSPPRPSYPARLVGVFDVEHDVSVGEFQRLAHEAIDDVLACGRTPVVVGGTGLYLRAALSDLELPPPPEADVRRALGGVLRRARRRARARAAADARSRSRRARAPERPPPRRARARACGGGRDACRRRPVERRDAGIRR